MSQKEQKVQFEDGMSVFHPVYAFKSLANNWLSDKTLIVGLNLLIAHGITGFDFKYVFYVVSIMIFANVVFPSKEPEKTDILKVNLLLANILNKKFGVNFTNSARKSELKRGGIACETVRYRP